MGKGDTGLSLLEVLVALALVGLLAAVMGGVIGARLQEARGHRLALDVEAIGAAARTYWMAMGSWPADVAALRAEGYIPPGMTGVTPFGGSYTLTVVGPVLQVRAVLPAGVGVGARLPFAQVILVGLDRTLVTSIPPPLFAPGSLLQRRWLQGS